jgi:hypothetical protein
MDDLEIRSAAARRYPYLQGLLMVPVGLWVVVVAITTSRWWPWSDGGHGLLVAIPAGVAAALACYGVTRYYQKHFGRVVIPKQRRTREQLLTVLAMLVTVVAPILGEVARLPVNLYGLACAFGLLAMWKYGGVLRLHHVLLVAGLVILSLLPLGGSSLVSGSSTTTSTTVVALGLGVVSVCAGLIDHAYLVRWLGPAKPVDGTAVNETSRVGT